MKLEFYGENGRRTIGKPKTVEKAWDIINKFLADHNFKSYYSRINFFEDMWEIDVGSWTEKFILSELNEDAQKYKQIRGIRNG